MDRNDEAVTMTARSLTGRNMKNRPALCDMVGLTVPFVIKGNQTQTLESS